MAQRGSDVSQSAAENAQRIEGEIEALQSCLRESTNGFGEFWRRVRELNGLFQTLRPVFLDDRQKLRAQLNKICAEAKERQAEITKNWENRKAISANKRNIVESKIHEAYFQAKGGSNATELAKAGELLKTALEWMKAGWSGFTPTTQLFAMDDGKMTKADHDACFERWKEANEMLQSRRLELGERNFGHYRGEAEDALGIAEYDPRRAKEKVQAIQKAVRGIIMTRDQFSELDRLLDRAWQRASGKSRGEWEEKLRGSLQWKRDRIRKEENSIDCLEEQIDHCRTLMANAKTDDYANEVHSWIEQKFDAIAESRRLISKLEDEIRDVESKLHR